MSRKSIKCNFAMILAITMSSSVAWASPQAGKITFTDDFGRAFETSPVAERNEISSSLVPQTKKAPGVQKESGTTDKPKIIEEAPVSYDVAPKASPKPWKGLFYNNDFSYMNDPCHDELWGECFKEMPVGCDSWISAGGEFRYRYMNEENRLRPGGPAKSTYDLWRWRNYVDFHYSDRVRGYVEFIDASIFNHELAPVGIDLNRWDILNAFVDIGISDSNAYFRFGRQELLYGSQRLLSPLDWSNTRRNFQGFKFFTHGENWDFDIWATQPVNTAAGNGPLSVFDNGRDKPDGSRYFSGAYASYHGDSNHTFDSYWMWDRESGVRNTGADRSRHTVGGRWLYNRPVQNECCETRVWHAEIESGYQFGHDTGETVKAGFFTAGVGHTWKSAAWKPSLWLFYDWASGDDSQTDTENNTFNQLFPLGHAYIGLIDNVGRQNISNINMRLIMKPTNKLKLITQMHWMNLATDNDLLYNVAGVGLGTRNSGKKIGNELDLLANYQFSPNCGVQAGYFWFWYGNAVTNSGLNRSDASQFYLQTTLRY